MKFYKSVLLIVTVIVLVLFLSSCTRTEIDDPNMTGYAGYEINLSGTANPSTLFVNQGTGTVSSNITMLALYNTGAPAGGKRIMMKINDDFGKFVSTGKNYAYITTNSSGVANVRYRVRRTDRTLIGSSYLAYIEAYLQDDNRLDNLSALIYDLIPILLITDLQDTEVNTLSYIITSNPDEDGTPDSNILLTATTGGTITLFLYNSTGTDAIQYQISVVYTTGSGFISSPTTGSTGSTDTTESIAVNTSGTAGDVVTITYTATAPTDVIGQSFSITITLQ